MSNLPLLAERLRTHVLSGAVALALVAGVPAALPAAAVSTSPARPSTSAASADDGATVTGRRWIRPGRELDLVIDSPALQTTARVRLLLPRGWSPTATRRWPVLYLLHGCCDDDGYTIWTRRTDVERVTADQDVIVVMPSAGWAGFYSNWSNHGDQGAPRWEDFHLTELRQILERGYRAGSRRAVAGLSMGGFGALSYAARHPHLFAAAASFSGVVHTLMDWRGPALTTGLVLSGGSEPTALWGDPALERGTWAAHNPFDLAARLRGLPLYVSSGNGLPGPLDPVTASPDPLEAPIGEMNRLLLARLREQGVPITAHLYGPGTHTWPYWQRELHRALPMLMTALRGRAGTTDGALSQRQSPVRYVAMGDSFSSAAGVLPVDPAAPPLCERSTRNYPRVIAATTGAQLVDVTCGGAATADYVTSQYPGVPPQLQALTRGTRLVTMTIGLNDSLLFVRTQAACGLAGMSTAGTGSPCRDRYGSQFADTIRSTTFPALVKALRAVRARAPRARVAILGIPWILPKAGGCFPTMPVARGDVPYVRGIQAVLNDAIRRAAAATGAHYVDFSQTSEGHDACRPAGVRWIEPALLGDNPIIVHPNALGEARMAARTMHVLGLR